MKQDERPSTYVVQDRKSEQELERLMIQEKLSTTAMGGVLPEQVDPRSFQRMLDVGCGPGGWIIDVAKSCPTISQLIGIDISDRIIQYARAQAQMQQVSDRVEFHVMDALLMLEFATDFFDLVNLRFGISFLRTWDWPKMLNEMQRVTRPGGVIRVTEGEIAPQATSPALTQLFKLLVGAFFSAGHLFEQEPGGLTVHLPALFKRHGIEQVQTHKYSMESRAGTPQGQAGIEDIQLIFRTVRPFIQKWGGTVAQYDTLYQQALDEMQQPNFSMTSNAFTVWGVSPQKN